MRQLRWIVRERRKGALSAYQIARQQQITPRYVRMLYRRYQAMLDYLVDTIRLKRCGRKPKVITEYEETEIMKAKKNIQIWVLELWEDNKMQRS